MDIAISDSVIFFKSRVSPAHVTTHTLIFSFGPFGFGNVQK